MCPLLYTLCVSLLTKELLLKRLRSLPSSLILETQSKNLRQCGGASEKQRNKLLTLTRHVSKLFLSLKATILNSSEREVNDLPFWLH